MPSIVWIRVVEARDLPVMNKKTKSSDAYCVTSFAGNANRTDIIFNSLNPVFNADYRYEIVDDGQLQDSPIHFKVMDKDMLVDDNIGVVHLDISNLLTEACEPNVNRESHLIDGWFPLYDTLEGVRGELHVIVRLELIVDINKFDNASTSVHFFGASELDKNVYDVTVLGGLVDELTVTHDPEFDFADNFRSARVSNEKRQDWMYRMSSTLRRQAGLKVIEWGGNAVLGYRQHFDLEGDSGLVGRCYGTMCVIRAVESVDRSRSRTNSPNSASKGRPSVEFTPPAAISPPIFSLGPSVSNSSAAFIPLVSPAHISKEGMTLFRTRTKSGIPAGANPSTILPPPMRPIADEVQILSISCINVLMQRHSVRLAGMVGALSVKYLGKLHSKIADQETRDGWWAELREEVRSNARSLLCGHVLGYEERVSLYNDVMILSATGTAAVVVPQNETMILPVSIKAEASSSTEERRYTHHIPSSLRVLATPEPVFHRSVSLGDVPSFDSHSSSAKKRVKPGDAFCQYAHVPFNLHSAPFANMRLVPCNVCNKAWVPEILLCTIDPPRNLPITGPGVLVEARVCRKKIRGVVGEKDAMNVSEALPFIEYDLHRQLLLKIRLQGHNAAFGVYKTIEVGPTMILGVITATSIFLKPLPPPPVISIRQPIVVNDAPVNAITKIQRTIEEISKSNKEYLNSLTALELSTTRRDLVRKKEARRAERRMSWKSTRSGSSLDSEGDMNDSLPASPDASTDSKTEAPKPPMVRHKTAPSLSSTTAESPKHDTSRRKSFGSVVSDLAFDMDEEGVMDPFVDSRDTYVLEVDDNTEGDLMGVILDKTPPHGIGMCNTGFLPGMGDASCNIRQLTAMRRVYCSPNSASISAIITDMQKNFVYKLMSWKTVPAAIVGLRTYFTLLPEANMIEVTVTAMAVKHPVTPALKVKPPKLMPTLLPGVLGRQVEHQIEKLLDGTEEGKEEAKGEERAEESILEQHGGIAHGVPFPHPVQLTPLDYIPGHRVVRYLGRCELHFIRESTKIKEEGGYEGFFQTYSAEARAVLRSNVVARGGNALLSYKLVPRESGGSTSVGSIYHILSLSGDIVQVVKK